MTNMTSDVQRPVQLPAGGITTRALRLAGYTNYSSGSTAFTVYKGAILVCDVTDTDGYYSPLQSSLTVTTSDIFGGIALEKQKVTSTDTADGSVLVTAAVNGVWGFSKGSIAITDIGANAFASDDGTVTTTATGNLEIGTIVDVDSSYVWIDISGKAGKLSANTA